MFPGRSIALKRFSIDCLLALCVATVLFGSTAYATEVALTGDAHVNLLRSSTNFGTLANLYIGNGNTALLQFDLSTLPSGLTAGQISRATLTLFVNRVNNGGAVNLSPVTSAWSESTVTYATLPTIGAAVNTFTAAAAGQYVTVDVTSLVQGWITTPANNNGFALTSSVANVLLDSKENDETGHAAELDVTINSTGATGPQGPAGPQGVQGVPGVSGAIGPVGPAGVTGATGATGATGYLSQVTTYNAGTNYAQGSVVFYAGSTYQSSINSNTGNIPSAGAPWTLIVEAGATGAVGPQGIQGIQGIQGATGLQGPQGATGTTGNTGSVGPAGPQGSIGLTGPQGPQGTTGATGATGTFSEAGNWSSATTYQIGQVVFCAACSTNGSSYIALAINTNLDPPTQPTFWGLVAQVGATGATGSTGLTGPQGPQGEQGSAGTGSVTSVTVGTVGNTAAAGAGTLTISNTTTTPTISINFPSGSTGFTWSGSIQNQGDGTWFVSPTTTGGGEFSASQLAFNAAPAACTVRSLTVNAITTDVVEPIEADTTVFTVFHNDNPTSMTCTIASGTTNNRTYSCSDSTHTFPVSSGDRISLQFAESLTDNNFQIVNYGTTLVCS
jgi:hypothetical protein